MRCPPSACNSAISISADGEILGVASKQRLLAFGETVPFWSVIPFLQRIFRCPGLVPGREPEVLPALASTAGVLNCYEDLIPEQGRIVAEGTHDQLVAEGGLYARLARLQFTDGIAAE